MDNRPRQDKKKYATKQSGSRVLYFLYGEDKTEVFSKKPRIVALILGEETDNEKSSVVSSKL